VIWRNKSGRELFQPVDAHDVDALWRLREAMLASPVRAVVGP
jgi:hypothetical protein